MENESDWMMLFEHSLDPTMWYLPFLVQTFCWEFLVQVKLRSRRFVSPITLLIKHHVFMSFIVFDVVLGHNHARCTLNGLCQYTFYM